MWHDTCKHKLFFSKKIHKIPSALSALFVAADTALTRLPAWISPALGAMPQPQSGAYSSH